MKRIALGLAFVAVRTVPATNWRPKTVTANIVQTIQCAEINAQKRQEGRVFGRVAARPDELVQGVGRIGLSADEARGSASQAGDRQSKSKQKRAERGETRDGDRMPEVPRGVRYGSPIQSDA